LVVIIITKTWREKILILNLKSLDLKNERSSLLSLHDFSWRKTGKISLPPGN